MSESTIPDVSAAAVSDRPRRPRRVWRQGGSSVRRWNIDVLAAAVFSLGAGVLLGALAATLIRGEVGAVVGMLALWAGMIAPVVFAFRRGIPRGLFAFRAADILYGLVLGLALRTAQGWIAAAAGDTAWPAYPTLDGGFPLARWLGEVVSAGLIGPVVEEAFFRGVILVVVFTLVRRASSNRLLAGIVAAVVSTVLFVAAHAIVAPVAVPGILALTLVGAVTSTLVLLTGRLWSAIAVHVVYNLSFLVLVAIGTLAR